MPARVILSVVDGPLAGAKYRFDERMACILGRAENCTLRIPEHAADGVSRHHCMLDINPPQASIQDLGSRFGTTLNGENIGRKPNDAEGQLPMRRLKDLDVFQVGHLKFQVETSPGAICAQCGCQIPEADETATAKSDGSHVCKGCARSSSMQNSATSLPKMIRKPLLCSRCGAIVDDALAGLPAGREGIICSKCRNSQAAMSTCILSNTDLERRTSNLLGIDGFNVIKQIGRGGMGAVYLARNNKSGELMALKIMLPDMAIDEKAREEFLREAQNSIKLKHPNIVEAKMAGYSGGALYIALEYCPEGTLKSLLAKNFAPLPMDEACEMAVQMLDALEYAHGQGLVHRDIKPENIFLAGQPPHWTAKIADFGLAKTFDTAGLSGCTLTGDFSGTLGFIPRQQFLNYKYVKPEVDVWAAAATLYWMLTMRTPREFDRDPFKTIQETSPIPLQARMPSMPDSLAKLLDSALDDSSKLRFKSATQLKTALLECLAK